MREDKRRMHVSLSPLPLPPHTHIHTHVHAPWQMTFFQLVLWQICFQKCFYKQQRILGKLMLHLWSSHSFKKYLNHKYLIFIYLFGVRLSCKTRHICVFTSHHPMLPFIFYILKICHLMFLFYIYNFNGLHSTFKLIFFWSKKIQPNSCDRVQDNYCPETKCSNYTVSPMNW